MQRGFLLLEVVHHMNVLIEDDRIDWACPIIGCPSYIELMEFRLRQQNLPVEAPHLPKSFVQLLDREDPGSIYRRTNKISERLKKPILVLSGGDDPLVPWSASETLISELQRESKNLKVNVYEGVGHEYAPQMGSDFYSWVLQFL
jgi:dipeptidyl aminopeptidase/acylaminoacyl peptidase